MLRKASQASTTPWLIMSKCDFTLIYNATFYEVVRVK
jgi:hypothetical protein